MKKNYKEDFTAVIRMRYPDGETVGIPDYDFDMHFTSGFTEYTAGRRNGQLYRCAVSEADPTVLLVRFDNHGLHPCPSLGLRVVYHIPDSDFPDGFRDVVRTQSTDICLTVGASDIPTAAEISVILPYIKGEKGDPGKDGVDAAPYDDTEIRREIVGLWDATAEMQAKLADLYSTETRNLLKRLGYNDDDIEEYIWAVAHLDLDITMDQLRRSVDLWENKEEKKSWGEKLDCAVIPKWDYMSSTYDSSLKFASLFDKDSALYLPYIYSNSTETWFSYFTSFLYTGGITTSQPTKICITNPQIIGIGEVSGQISLFSVGAGGYTSQLPTKFKFIRILKSDIRFDARDAFRYCYKLQDIRGVDLTNALAISEIFCSPSVASDLKNGCLNLSNASAAVTGAIKNRSLTDCQLTIYNIDQKLSPGDGSMANSGSEASIFTNCAVEINAETLGSFYGLTMLGWIRAAYNSLTRIQMPKASFVNLLYMYAFNGPTPQGVWEINCPKLTTIVQRNSSIGDVGAMLFNIGTYLPPNTTIPLYNLIGPTFQTDPFHRSFASWVSVPESSRPCNVTLRREHAAELSEEEIADLSEKGFTISVV